MLVDEFGRQSMSLATGSVSFLPSPYRVGSADEPFRPMSHFLLVKSLKNTFLKAIYFNNYKRLNLLLYI
jgi:hypothetical protein